MKKLLLKTGLVMVILLSSLMGAQKSEMPKFVGNTEGIKEYSLTNGMKLLLIPDASQSNMVVNIVYNVGSKDEGYGEKGMAHLLEHMLFKSTKNLGDIKKQLSDKGGIANGTTYFDRTNYYEIFPSSNENLKWAINMEADRMLNATILQEDLDKEFSVVRNEFEISENNPARVLMDKVYSTAYMWHNYGNSTIGSKEDIERVKASTLRKFYEKYYQPDNATLIIAGNFDEDNALKYVAENFSVLPKPNRVLSATYTVEPPQDGEKTIELKRTGESKLVTAGYHSAAYADKDFAALAALNEILTANPSGYLYKNLVESQKVASLWAYSPEVRDPGLFYFNFDVSKDKDIDATKNLVKAELDKIATIKYTEQDLARAKAKLLKQIADTRNNTLDFAIYLTEIVGAGNHKLAFLYRDNVENLTVADINRVAEKYFRSNNRTVGVFIPTSNENRVKPTEYLANQIENLTANYKGKTLEKEPAAFEASIANLKKNLTEGVLTNGMKYGLVNKEIKGDKIKATFKFRVGNDKDLAGKNEIGKMTAALLNAGTKTRTKEQIQDRLDQLKSTIYFRSSPQTLTIAVETYKNSYPEVMDLLKDMLANSTFPQNELTNKIAEINTDLESRLKDPMSLTLVELDRAAKPYPKESVFYTGTMQEVIDNNKKITRDQIINYYANLIGADNGFGTVIGNVDPKTATASLENTFGKLSSTSKYVEIKPTYFETKKTMKKVVTPDKENAVASGIYSFRMNQKSDDYAAFVLANEMMGGGFLTARIPARLREKDGISYGAGSYMTIPISNDVAQWGFYSLYNPTKREAVEKAITEEINKAAQEGITSKELVDSKLLYANAQKTMLGMDESLIELVNNKLQYDVPLEDYDTLNNKIQELKIDDINKVLKKYFSGDNMVSVYVGDFKDK